MKRALLLLSLLATTSAFAQISKGNVLAGGGATFTSSHHEIDNYALTNRPATATESSLAVSLNGGYFLVDKLAVGLRLGVDRLTEDISIYSYSYENTTSQLGPFVRYYFLHKDKTVNLFADASYSSKYAGIFKKDVSPLRGYTLLAGPAFFLNRAVALEFTLGYSHSKYKNSEDGNNTFLSGVGLQVHLGKGK